MQLSCVTLTKTSKSFSHVLRARELDAIESQSQNRLSDENWMEKRRGGLKDEYEVFRLKKSLEDYQDGFRLRKRDPKLHLEGFRLE